MPTGNIGSPEGVPPCQDVRPGLGRLANTAEDMMPKFKYMILFMKSFVVLLSAVIVLLLVLIYSNYKVYNIVKKIK